jgi:cytochrome c oxidase cbb3-type subunit IV
MYKDVLRSIEGIEIYPIISLVIFTLFFVLLFVWIKRKDANYIDEMSHLPLNDDIISGNKTE